MCEFCEQAVRLSPRTPRTPRVMAERFRKKPVEVEAMRWPGADDCDSQDVLRWGDGVIDLQDGTHAIIRTLEGAMTANVGDWIIRGVKGEFYPCKPDIFEATYERVDACVDAAALPQ